MRHYTNLYLNAPMVRNMSKRDTSFKTNQCIDNLDRSMNFFETTSTRIFRIRVFATSQQMKTTKLQQTNSIAYDRCC